MKKINHKILLLIILLLGFCLRTYKLDRNPAGFFCDEASIGYNAYKVLKTGADEYGVPHPFFFRAFGDYRNPLPIYFNIPSVAIFGLNEFSVRLTAAIAGTLTILFVFLLTKKIFGTSVALLSSFLLTISPWHIHYSRFASEYIYFPFLVTLGVYFFNSGLERKIFLLIGFLLLGFSLYTYYPAWLVMPLLTIGLIFIYRKQLCKIKKELIIGIFIFLLTFIPLFFGIKNKTALTRWNHVSTFKTLIGTPLKQSALKITKTSLAHFSYDFLFKKGDIGYPGHFINRFSVRGMGELYLFQLPFLIIGTLLLLIKWKEPKSQLLFLWVILYPLGSTLIGTDGGGPFAFRSIIGVIPFQILTAIAINFIISRLKFNQAVKYIFIISLFILSLSSLSNYLHRYYIEYPLYSSDFWGWQFGPREVMKYFLEVKNNYDNLFLMGDFNSPEIFVKFYDPENLCQNHCQIGGLEKLNLGKRQLYAISTTRLKEIPDYFKAVVLKTIYYPNKTPAFLLLEIKPK